MADHKQELIDSLAGAESLSESLIAELTARRNEVIPELMAILADEELADVEAPGEGWLPIHAVTLLVRLNAVEAIDTMLETLSGADPFDELYSKLVFGLKDLGAPVLEPVLKALEKSNSDQRGALLEILSGIKVQDDRIFALLLDELKTNPEFGAGCLAEYGDPAALPHLSAFLDKCKLPSPGSGPYAGSEIIEISGAIEELGAPLTESQEALRESLIKMKQKQSQFEKQKKKSAKKPASKTRKYSFLPRPGVNIKIY